MRVNENCAKCLMDKQLRLTDNEAYLGEVRRIIAGRAESDTAPYLLYLFNKEYEKYFGESEPYRDIRRKYNDLALSIEERLRKDIQSSDEPLIKAFIYARTGNYIDFGALDSVDDDKLISLLNEAEAGDRDRSVMRSFENECSSAKSLLLIADNCGEIVFDKLFIEQLRKDYPQLDVSVLVRGGEVLNDVTMEDAVYTGVDMIAKVIPNGNSAAGTIYEMLSDEAREALDNTDVILAKGQGNYESLCGQGRHIFYSFLCKCDLFTERFAVPKLTGLFIEENRGSDRTAREKRA